MASKGQKFQKFKAEDRVKAVNDYLNGARTRCEISQDLDVNLNTIDNWIHKYRSGNTLTGKQGRKKNENIDYKERYAILKKFQAFLKEQREKK